MEEERELVRYRIGDTYYYDLVGLNGLCGVVYATWLEAELPSIKEIEDAYDCKIIEIEG